MAKLFAILFVVVATTSCGSGANAPLATRPPDTSPVMSFHAAPVEGSPEQAAIDLGRDVRFSPADGVPREGPTEIEP